MSEEHMQYFGLVEVNDDSQDDQIMQEESLLSPPPKAAPKKGSRKKSSTSTKGTTDDDSKKTGKRGRPRVEPQDESAIERRRTQIRLAQRAYRERKETTIAELEKRVTHLQNTITELSGHYFDFSSKALASGLGGTHPALAQCLHATTQRFVALEKAAATGGDYELPPDDGLPKRKKLRRKVEAAVAEEVAGSGDGVDRSVARRSTGGGAQQQQQQQQQGRAGDEVQRQDSSEASSLGDLISGETMPLGYRLVDDSPGQISSGDDDLDAIGEPVSQSAWAGETMELQQYNAQIPQTHAFTESWKELVDRPIKPIFTYNFQETSFSRRLIRRSYERAYQMLSNPASDPEVIKRVLRYSLCLGDRDYITQAIKARLLKTADESLEVWTVPSLHIGDAGLHYSRELQNSDDPSAQDFSRKRNFGPYPYRGLMKPPVEDFPYHLEKFAGVEGTWFDAYDVDQYLRGKGMFLDGSSSTAVVEIGDTTPAQSAEVPFGSPHTNSTDSLSIPQSPASANDLAAANFTVPGIDGTMFPDFESFHDPAFGNLNGTLNLDFTMAPSLNVGKNPVEQQQLHDNFMFPNPLLDGSAAAAAVPQKKKAVIDVDKLLEALTDNSFCLGRAPGYRLEDVNAAIENVLQEAF